MGEEKDTEKTLTARFLTLDRRWWFLLMIIMIILPVLNPLGLPMVTSEHTTIFKESIDTLVSGDLILVDMECGSAGYGECGLALEAFLKYWHQLPQDIYLVTFTTNVEGQALFLRAFDVAGGAQDKVYGVDWAELGYLGMDEVPYVNLANDPKFGVIDARGNDLNTLEIMQRFQTAQDVDRIYCFSDSGMISAYLVRNWHTPYNTPIYFSASGGIYSTTLAYYPQQIKAVLFGLTGAAELEFVTQNPGPAILSNDALTTVLTTMLIIVVLTNIVNFIQKGNEKG
jgi:hypothetical protein